MWGVAAICWAIWKARNNACFEKKLIKNPVQIICHACALMKYWTGLFADINREELEDGVNTMLKVALDILVAKSGKQSTRGTSRSDDITEN